MNAVIAKHGLWLCFVVGWVVSCASIEPGENSARDALSDSDDTGDVMSDSDVDSNGDSDSRSDSDSDSDNDTETVDEDESKPTVFGTVSGGRLLLGERHRCIVTVGGSPPAVVEGSNHRARIGIGAFLTP